MKFYNRQEELRELRKVYGQCSKQGKMTVLTGRRRVGKTMLALDFVRKSKHIYLFASRKSEPLLCSEYLRQIEQIFPSPVIGQITSFKDVFQILLEMSRKTRFTLIIDEFQEFYHINPSLFSDMQNLWDRYKRKVKLNLIVIGSVYSLMNKIFQDAKEPLFNRADRMFFIKPFSVKDIYNILGDYNNDSIRTLFDYYIITGGMPIYIDLLVTNSAFSLDEILDFILHPNSTLLYEGKNVLIEEFGKEYSTYFSILSLIASGKTSRPEMESILQKNIGGYLERLEGDFAILARHTPINAKPGSRLVKYKIRDNFLNFWFRFIYRNLSAIETGNFDYVKEIIRRDYPAYSGLLLENLFRDLLADSKQYNVIGSYWDRKSENEIDIVAVNEKQKNLLLAEVKLDSRKIHLTTLRKKAQALLNSYPGYSPKYLGLSLDNIPEFL